MKTIVDFETGDIPAFSMLVGHPCDIPRDGFADCILAFPTQIDGFQASAQVERIVEELIVSHRLLSNSGSMWVCARESYNSGRLAMIPERIVMELVEKQKWIIRNEVILECKVADPAPESRLKRSYEKAFHLAKGMQYSYDRTMGTGKRWGWETSKGGNGKLSSRTGVVGTKYAKYIHESTLLTYDEKQAARAALAMTFQQFNAGEISDYRMAIKGIHKVSGFRAKEVAKKGFSISKTKSHSLPMSDLWRDAKTAQWKDVPGSVAELMVRLTCPLEGVVFDLFPSKETAIAVLRSGHKYVAASPVEAILEDIASHCAPFLGGSLFDDMVPTVDNSHDGEEAIQDA